MEVADDERTLRRARRVVWVVRLVFYPGAAIVAIALLTGQGPPHVRHCDNGRDHPAWVQTKTLTTRGDTFDSHEVWDERWVNGQIGTATLRVRGRLDGDTARGTVSFVQRLGDYICAGETDFSVD